MAGMACIDKAKNRADYGCDNSIDRGITRRAGRERPKAPSSSGDSGWAAHVVMEQAIVNNIPCQTKFLRAIAIFEFRKIGDNVAEGNPILLTAGIRKSEPDQIKQSQRQ